jgi:hypothetical protein
MTTSGVRLFVIVLSVALTAAACSSDNSSSSVLPTPSGTVTTETFTGTVQPGSLDFHTFNVTTGGTINITLVAAGPPPTITMGLAIGNPSSAGVCAVISGGSTVTTPGTTAQLTGTVAAGSYCVEVVDVGNAAGAIAYTVTVAHT